VFNGILSKFVKKHKLNYAHACTSLPVASPRELVIFIVNVPNVIKVGREMGHRPKMSQTGSKLTRMHVYYFRCYWLSNLLFFVRCVTYIPNLKKVGQKLRSLSRTISISSRQTDRQTYMHSSDFISVQCHALHLTNTNRSVFNYRIR